jgi:thiol peroxidase
MANITLGGTPVETVGTLPKTGTKAPDFELTNTELKTKKKSDFNGNRLILNIFPSVDTGVCAKSVRTFNEKASQLDNTKVLCISKDLPFAMSRFCAAEGLENVISLTDYKTGKFGEDYGVTFKTGGFETLLSRSVVVVDEDGTILHTEQVSETGDEPNYEAALASLS